MNREPYICGAKDFYYLFSIIDYDDLPIVFIAEDDVGNLYLVDCVECRGYQRWTIALTTVDTIQAIIDQELTVYDGLKANGDIKILATYSYTDKTFTQKEVPFSELTESDLPDEDSKVTMYEIDVEDHMKELRNRA